MHPGFPLPYQNSPCLHSPLFSFSFASSAAFLLSKSALILALRSSPVLLFSTLFSSVSGFFTAVTTYPWLGLLSTTQVLQSRMQCKCHQNVMYARLIKCSPSMFVAKMQFRIVSTPPCFYSKLNHVCVLTTRKAGGIVHTPTQSIFHFTQLFRLCFPTQQ